MFSHFESRARAIVTSAPGRYGSLRPQGFMQSVAPQGAPIGRSRAEIIETSSDCFSSSRIFRIYRRRLARFDNF
jgi:hypothetical protein